MRVKLWSSPVGHVCHQHEQRTGEVAVLSQEKAVDMGHARTTSNKGSEPHCAHFITISSGEKGPEGGWMEGKTHRLYFDCISRLLEVTDRLNKILCFGAAGNEKVETSPLN